MNYPRQCSTLDFRSRPFWMEIKLGGIGRPRTRRTILLRVFRQLSRVLQFPYEEARLYSPEVINWEDRPASLYQAQDGRTPSELEGFALRVRRNEAGLTQEQLAALVGMNRSYLVQIERGQKRPSQGLRVRISQILTSSPSNKIQRLERGTRAASLSRRANQIFDLNSS